MAALTDRDVNSQMTSKPATSAKESVVGEENKVQAQQPLLKGISKDNGYDSTILVDLRSDIRLTF